MREALAWAAGLVDDLLLRVLRWGSRQAGVALMYHRVAPEPGDSGREFVPALSVSDFNAQIGYLRRRFDIVPAADLQDAVARRRRGDRFPAAITFDDNTRTHVDHAAPALRAHGVPATFFLNGIGQGAPSAMWWEVLQRAVDGGASWDEVLPSDVLDRAHQVSGDPLRPYGVSVAVEELPVSERRALAAAVSARLGDAAPRTEFGAADVRALSSDGLTVGFHGSRHEPMALLDAPELAAELDDARGELAQVSGTELTEIAYPHGRVSPEVVAAARARGFRCGFTVRATAVTPLDDPLLLGRIDGARPPRDVRRAIVRAIAAVPR